MKKTPLFLLYVLICFSFFAQKQKQPNILFIAIDDLNDWVSPLEGNKQAITPNMDKLTKSGSMVFKNAITPAPICGPSRSAILSGFLPSTSGVYGNSDNMLYSDIVKENPTLPEYFSLNGYHTLSNGKMFHKHGTKNGKTDFGEWAFDEFARARRYNNDAADKKFVTSSKAGSINGVVKPEYKQKKAKLSWGPTKDKFEKTVDFGVADWARKQLQRDFDKPFFMSVGFIKPHLPWFVPKEFFDLYDINKIEDILIKEDDLVDITDANGKQKFKPTAEYKWIKKHNLNKEATRAYLANVSFVDKCLGIVMDALEKSNHADNTIVVIWGDHGWHLGEKQRYLKNTLWSEAVKPPFFVKLPGMKETVILKRTVSLLDLYPTLINLAKLPKKENLDGHDFSNLLKNPTSEWEYPGVTVSSEGTSVLSEQYHYIQYLSGEEELYDVIKDPNEWNNLISNSKYQKEVSALKKWIPIKRKKASKERYGKPKNYVDADQDETIKSTRKFK
ncbi:sulfatase [Polaribacter sp. KT25b]|uniref:sulfatase n=1 Tax=Polaribacter sp. KT25b TaxID=1855336 RepID=UPI0015615AF8|nr:sulfatase [Polaribacter sp. KT25b]